MTLFNKKKNDVPAVLYTLNKRLKTAREKQETKFYYPLWEHEVDIVRAWALRNRLIVEPDHITDGDIYYKFYGYRI